MWPRRALALRKGWHDRTRDRRREERDAEETVAGRGRPRRRDTTPAPNDNGPKGLKRKEKENAMFARNAARTLALAFALVALLGGATTAVAADEAAAAPAKKVVNINQASTDELARLPRVGPSLAGKIVAHRSQNGPFKRTEDLMEVKGIGEKMYAVLKPYVTTSGPTTLTEKVSSSKKGASAKNAAKGKPAAEKAGR